MARMRGAKSSSHSNRKRSLRKEPVPDPVSEPSQLKAIPPPVKPAPPKPPVKRTYQVRSRPLQKRPRLESSEPIDLTEQSPEPSPIPSPVPTPIPSRFPCQFCRRFHLRRRKQNLRSLKRHFRAPNSIRNSSGRRIRRPMLTQPPIEGNLDCRARQFHSELCFDIAAFDCSRSLHRHSTC
ncbi:hypothetical protein CK203_115031 [Vitis vinifera]|uniref:Uncharacterized protein n=1 Tax=Vitis vinifera TaxID=29760 RepID=A0A438BNZ4_VITVI|nr:hypothetical protein CK203_115031 [Vitis vinifera]